MAYSTTMTFKRGHERPERHAVLLRAGDDPADAVLGTLAVTTTGGAIGGNGSTRRDLSTNQAPRA